MTQGKPPDIRIGDEFDGRDLLDLIGSVGPKIEGSDSILATTIGNTMTLEVIPPITRPQRPREFRIVTVFGDYLQCAPISGTDGDVNIARPPDLQRSATEGKTLPDKDGVSVTFAFTDDQTRTATIASIAETQLITPAYVPEQTSGGTLFAGSTIWASFVGDSGVTDGNGDVVSWLDINSDGRFFRGLPTLTGYDDSKTQVLVHVSGVSQWIDTTECA